MVRRVIRVAGPDPASIAALERRFAAVRQRLGVPEAFPPDVLAAAEQASRAPALPREDLTDIPFVTVDPPGSTDLDQAMALSRRGAGYHVDYAIADVPAFVVVRGPVDLEARRGAARPCTPPTGRRRCTRPCSREGAASLLEGQVRPAFVWRFDLDADGDVLDRRPSSARWCAAGVGWTTARCRRPRTTSARALPIPATTSPGRPCCCGRSASGGWPSRPLEAVPTCPLPEQEVTAIDGRYTLSLRPAVPAEDWNAQLSLLTGMTAATLMLKGGAGVLRTMPAPEPAARRAVPPAGRGPARRMVAAGVPGRDVCAGCVATSRTSSR